MARKSTAGDMIRSMGAGMKVLELLAKEIRNQGGNTEVLAFLTRPRFSEQLKGAVTAIVAQDWRIPASEMRSQSLKRIRRQLVIEPYEHKQVSNLWWFDYLEHLGVPFQEFSKDRDSGLPDLPSFMLNEFHGRRMEYPLLTQDRRRVVVYWMTTGGVIPPGAVIDASRITGVAFAEARYFDFDK